MSNSVVRTLKRVGLVSIASAIVISATAMTSPLALAAQPAANSSGQVPLDQQKTQQQQKNKQGNQPQAQRNTSPLKPPSPGQPPKPQPQQQVQQQKNQNNGQTQFQGGQQQTQQQKNLNNNPQFGQGQNNKPQGQQTQGQPPKNQPNGQAQKNAPRQRYDWAAYQQGHQPPQWQQYHKDFNPHPYQWNRTSNQRYHNQSYQRPHGWYAQRWVYGQILPTLFWSQPYWLTAYYNFGLIDPPYGYVWVQNGNDALLVNVQSGQILSVEYNVFYS
jgi:hypothetical protein